MTEYRDAYFPGTEELGPNEMRLTALGTGTPQLRPSQASASWFLELGNGDKFFFDMGAGSIKNLLPWVFLLSKQTSCSFPICTSII